jgi:proteasome lid subunit RPN8/RPN11
MAESYRFRQAYTCAVRIRRAALDALVAHARRDAPRECCGLLIGSDDEIVESVAVANVAVDPLRRYEVPPREHFDQVRRCRVLTSAGSDAVSVLGVYHSHPGSIPEPSETDTALACEEFVYVIAGPIDADEPAEIRTYRFRNGTFEPVTLVVTERRRTKMSSSM